MTAILTGLRRLEKEVAKKTARLGRASLYNGDALEAYQDWLPPSCIISDGPYGLGKFPGEPKSPDGLAEWYAPHAAAWARAAKPNTTLWFWNSEIGWANSHAALTLHGWQYEETVIWNKGIAHIAGNVNSKTIRDVPVVTEIAVRYTRRLMLENAKGEVVPAKQWLREEWQRSGLPLSQSNAATGTANAATRKYLTQCDMWYFPPGEAVEAMAAWCSLNGKPTNRPYFSIDGKTPIKADIWNDLRALWNHEHGRTNVWDEPPVHNGERIKVGSAYLHANQKPIELLKRQIAACTSIDDVVWEPFGGLCSGTIAALRLGRLAHAAEVNDSYFKAALCRLSEETNERKRA
ncbi:MAG: site-specific DNA-methyltransferase [Proteobacteria bacterium]|nr:site-specific DNA-methyltransferase [Pseudomonadota bacterium]